MRNLNVLDYTHQHTLTCEFCDAIMQHIEFAPLQHIQCLVVPRCTPLTGSSSAIMPRSIMHAVIIDSAMTVHLT